MKTITPIISLTLALITTPLTLTSHAHKTPTQTIIAQRCNSKYRLVIQPEGGSIKLLQTSNQNAQVAGILESGTIVEFRGWDETGQWAHIVSPGGIQGWIWSAYITCDF